jgi:putative PIN family toxin of toxin-antitoxin system
MRVVLDTNILVSGLLKPQSSCGKILELTLGGALDICLDARILLEYREVLHRPKFRFDSEQVEILLNSLEELALWLPIRPLSIKLHDRDDEAFLEVALGARASYLVSGNLRHFPKGGFEGVLISDPTIFLEAL